MTGTTSITTARDCLSDPEFVALLGCWERDRRCPLVLPDWLRERGLEYQAAVAEWCAWKGDRDRWERGAPPCGVFPNGTGRRLPCSTEPDPDDHSCYWFCDSYLVCAHHVPYYLLSYFRKAGSEMCGVASISYSLTDAMVSLLDRWAAALRDGHLLPPSLTQELL